MPESNSQSSAPTPAVCLGCALCCDDVEVSAGRGELGFSANLCGLGRDWFCQQAAAARQVAQARPAIAGQPSDYFSAVRAAADLIRGARSPLLCGLNGLSLAEQQGFAELALAIGAVVDVDWSERPTGNLAALQQTGRVTATLGQIAMQADLILLIEAAPERTHPRLGERLDWKGQRSWRFRTAGLAVGQPGDLTGSPVAEVVCDDAAELSDLIWYLRALVRGNGELASNCPPHWRQTLDELLLAMRSARGVALIGGSRLDWQPELALQVHQLARELNELCKAWLLPVGSAGNQLGAESVLAWSTGFPGSIDLRSKVARWERTDYSACELLRRGELDLLVCCLATGDAASWSSLPGDLREVLTRLPRVVFYSAEHPLVSGARVAIPVAEVGWDERGEVVRLDDLSLTVPAIDSTNRLGVGQVVRDLLRELP